MQRIPWVVQNRATYLWVLFLIPAASRFGHYLAPNQPIFKGHDYGIIISAFLIMIAAALWIPYRRNGSWPVSALLFFATATVAWVYQVLRTHLDDSLFNLTVFVLPAAILLITLKRFSRKDTWIALWVLGYSLLAVALLSLVLGSFGLAPDGFLVSQSAVSRIPWLNEIAPTRWGGPFGSVNYAAPVGGLLVLMGLSGNKPIATPLLFGGALVLILSQGRTALFALTAAATVQLLWGSRVAGRIHAPLIRIAVFLTLGAGLLFYFFAIDGTLNGRTQVWQHFSHTFRDAPLIGIGDSGVLRHVEEYVRLENIVPHTHAHSVMLDTYIRFGAILAILGIALYALALRSTIRALPEIGSTPLAIVVFVVIAGLAETIHAWANWSVYLAALTWTVLVSGSSNDDENNPMISSTSLSLERGSA